MGSLRPGVTGRRVVAPPYSSPASGRYLMLAEWTVEVRVAEWPSRAAAQVTARAAGFVPRRTNHAAPRRPTAVTAQW